MLIVYHFYRRIIYYFLFERINQRELWTVDCRRFQSASFTLKRQKMLYSSHSDWCFIKHHYKCKIITTVQEIKLKTIIKKIHNQLTTINLTFNSKKIQFIIYKCKMKIDLHQESDHFSIAMKLCLCTFFVQLMTCWLWKKINAETLNAHLRIHFFINFFLNNKIIINDKVVEITYAL